jgi:hypothetical protein
MKHEEPRGTKPSVLRDTYRRMERFADPCHPEASQGSVVGTSTTIGGEGRNNLPALRIHADEHAPVPD